MTAALTISRPFVPPGRPHAAISIRPVPALEPPTDEELARAGILPPSPLAQALPLGLPTTDQTRGRARRAATAPEPVRSDASPPTPAIAAAHRFLAACVEVLGGYRPPAHLRGLCTPEGFSAIALQLTGRHGARLAGRSPLIPRPSTGAPPRAARAGQVAPGSRVTVRRVVVCEPTPGVAEVAVVLSRRDRSWAMALRIERHGERWCCSYLRVI